ncbi:MULTISPECIES: hypothetical protein [unclassified Sphingomonas]|uniref:hypothetical protein n=1 Tax=unclassified Sphingomonas TaxID=196159 RepID=UPI000A7BDE4E|nr:MULTISPECIES: hypothetical protein [unclassified Sphingomonas]MCH4893694.1 hypothetical protein [Sphingomonas sp. SFZ2018-12]
MARRYVALVLGGLALAGAALASSSGWLGTATTSAGAVRLPATGDGLSALSTVAAQSASTVRSVLYPANWLPLYEGGNKDSSGRFLQDFSYAGYAMGDAPIPTSFNNGHQVNVVTQFGADNSYSANSNPNAADATTPIQNAINAVCAAGGGVVFLPGGGYRIRPVGTAPYALRLPCSNVILRGQTNASGTPQAYVFNDDPVMRAKRMIDMGPTDNRDIWFTDQATTPVAVTSATNDPTRTITVASTAGLAVGQSIIVRTDLTPAFRDLHGMGPNQNGCNANGCWGSANWAQGQVAMRRIEAILPGNQLRLDIPVRYILNPDATTGNNPRIYRTGTVSTNVGIENLYLAMRENTQPGLTDADINTRGTAAYETSNAVMIRVTGVMDGWIRNVRTFKPQANATYHIQSLGIAITRSARGISVLDCSISFPQNRLGSGNGYLFFVSAQENLIRNAYAEGGRHNFQMSDLTASGNVLLGGASINPVSVSDYHGSLAHANLVDGMRIVGPGWESQNRGTTSNGGGVTGTQNVFWNLIKDDLGTNVFVRSHQFGFGYVIGTRGNTASLNLNGAAFLAPADFAELINQGATLEPQSLYLDQKARRDASPSY